MSGVQETSCKLCLKTVTVEGFEVINNVIRDILDILLLKLKFDCEGKEVICNACRGKLYAALEFKSACLKTDYTIIPYLDCEKMLQLDIRDVYTKEMTTDSMDISDGQKICRLCMEPVESEFRCIREEELEAIEKLAPELIINIIKDPVICKECFDSVCTHNSFLKNCREVQEKIRGIFNSAATESQIDKSRSDLFLKTENQDIEFDMNGTEMSIKAESIDIKSEDEESSDSLLQSSDSESFMKSVLRDEEEDGCKHENKSTNDCTTKDKQDDKKYTALPNKDTLQLPIYKCDGCTYESKKKINFTKHQLVHKDPSQVKMYGCNDCDFKTKYKGAMKKHQLKHKDLSQVQTYKCDDCDFETKYKGDMKKHQLKHKDLWQVQTYRCNDCDFKTKYKSCIKKHQLKHKDPSQVQMYRCNGCDYETRYKFSMKNHQLKHKNPSQVPMYRCKECDFRTKSKDYIKRHQLKHIDPSQVQTYRCNDCNFETKYMGYMKKHQLKHKGPSQVQTYKCYDCDFESKSKSYIKRHQLAHREGVPTVIMNPNAGVV
ncbi:zinc finger Y-chromosomal protein 1-like [Anoplophora glabripennis]|uniref:zinc finger Y-chromosomal protein 1-like n=1 Tax=Anoplophora glabripennis TaxID=217634 RepID=UPI000C76F58F|nr:zinc finger Y-chromosomal protein 1-like [Anoplophora glabripennis]XP_023310314.1 zinc finger Y-chromosomal protein 1-like [Anoplophora glabripennis]